MCLSLFQIVRPRRRRRRRQRRQGERRAIRAHCRSRPVASSTQVTRPERSGALGAVTLRPAREPLRRSCGRRRRRRAPVWPQLSPAAAPSSNYEGSAGAVVYPASIRGPTAKRPNTAASTPDVTWCSSQDVRRPPPPWRKKPQKCKPSKFFGKL
ncbi:uncharacterized protein LOC143267629 [Peromyscus maniculatus bairdii]|uniref:uncharacterized protein LOC143267629 n=1 Tax=Peromyscus maniculatus bairdii TaxID=230844 RepID=UPI003FD12EDF